MKKLLYVREEFTPGDVASVTPELDIDGFDRLHIIVSGRGHSVADVSAQVMFSTPVELDDTTIHLVADGTVWYEVGGTALEFFYQAPPRYERASFVMSVPVIGPVLWQINLKNNGDKTIPLMVALYAQDI